jgi:polynucleotide 5'-hydroxyl-kinase GRC3/NOL9
MGWVKGLGADMNRKIESALHPTDIFELRGSSHETQRDSGIFPSTTWVDESSWSYNAYGVNNHFDDYTARMHILEPASSGFTTAGPTAVDHRNMAILSYFHALFPRHAIPGPLEQITAHQWDISRPLCAMPPFEVDCSTVFDKIILTGAGSEDVVGDEVSLVLNGAVVGLVVCDHGVIDQQPNSESLGPPYTRGCKPPSPLSSKCVGLAAVRGVSSVHPVNTSSYSKPTYLHLLTPVPYPLLSQSRVIVKGELELPIWAMLDFRSFFKDGQEIGDVAGVEPENVPYLQWGKAPQGVLGAEKRKIRRNLLRRGQL